MKLLYTNKNVCRVIISEPSSISDAIKDIENYMCKHSNFAIPFKCLEFTKNEIYVDIGTWWDIFYIIDFTEEDVEKYKKESKANDYSINRGFWLGKVHYRT